MAHYSTAKHIQHSTLQTCAHLPHATNESVCLQKGLLPGCLLHTDARRWANHVIKEIVLSVAEPDKVMEMLVIKLDICHPRRGGWLCVVSTRGVGFHHEGFMHSRATAKT